MMPARNGDRNAGMSGCCTRVPPPQVLYLGDWADGPADKEVRSVSDAQASLLQLPLPSSRSTREFTMLFADLRNHLEKFFTQVLEHQELFRGQMLSLHSASQASIDAQNLFKQRQEDLIREFHEFACNTPLYQNESQGYAKAGKMYNTEKIALAVTGSLMSERDQGKLRQDISVQPSSGSVFSLKDQGKQLTPSGTVDSVQTYSSKDMYHLDTISIQAHLSADDDPLVQHLQPRGSLESIADLSSALNSQGLKPTQMRVDDMADGTSSKQIQPVKPRSTAYRASDGILRASADIYGLSSTPCLSERSVAAKGINKKKTLPKERRGLFGDVGMDKTDLDKEEYSVTKFYHETGVVQWIAKSDAFSNVTLLVIFLNAVYIGYDADNNKEENLLDADLQFRVMENLFCVFFFFEWAVRFCAFARKCDCFKDMWFKFDSVLVSMMVLETWILPVVLSGGTGIPSGLIKLVRLLRLARMARIARSFPDLVAMVKGVKVASRAVGSALLMLVGLIYVFAIIMFTLLKDEPNKVLSARFRRLGLTMWTLLVDGTFLDSFGTVSQALMDDDRYLPMCVLLLFVLASALTVMNMLIGVLCEVVSAVASAEKEDCAIRMVKEKLLVLLKALDEDGSGLISREEIQAVLDHDDALDVFSSLSVDVNYLLEHLDMFFDAAPGSELTIQQIMEIILILRGDRNPTMKDMLLGQSFSRWKTSQAFAEVKRTILTLRPVDAKSGMRARQTVSVDA